MSCSEHTYISIFSNSLIQASIVFIFLTVFFFIYVNPVEKEEFTDQINSLVENIYDKKQVESLLPSDPKKKKILKDVLYGIIDSNEEELNKSSISAINEINQKNNAILKKSVITVLVTLIITVIILIIFAFFGYCIPLGEFTKEGIFILIFIFFTEFLFLNVITKNYISVNSDVVKKEILNSIINYKH